MIIIIGKKTSTYSYLLHPNYEETSLCNVQHKHHVHQDQKGHVFLIYGTSTILLTLKDFSILAWSIIVICR